MDHTNLGPPSLWWGLLEISKGLIAPLVAVITTYIAFQQWKANKRKIDMELFDRRFHVYEEVQNFFGLIFRELNVSSESIFELRRKTSEAEFLFGEEVSAYIQEICQRGAQLGYFRQQYRDSTQPFLEGDEFQNQVQRLTRALRWNSDISSLAKRNGARFGGCIQPACLARILAG